MKIYLQCPGRMCNQLLSWSKAVATLNGEKDCDFALRWPAFQDRIEIPRTEFVRDFPEGLPKLRMPEALTCQDDFIWVWGSFWFRTHADSEHRSNLSRIRFCKALEEAATKTVEENRIRVGVHLRCGDYVRIDWDKPPDPMPPFVRPRDSYYVNGICRGLEECGPGKVFLATDATPEDIPFMSRFDVVNGRKADPLFDLLVLSKCKFIVGSMSTFSMVAGFMSDAGSKILFPSV